MVLLSSGNGEASFCQLQFFIGLSNVLEEFLDGGELEVWMQQFYLGNAQFVGLLACAECFAANLPAGFYGCCVPSTMRAGVAQVYATEQGRAIERITVGW